MRLVLFFILKLYSYGGIFAFYSHYIDSVSFVVEHVEISSLLLLNQNSNNLLENVVLLLSNERIRVVDMVN